MVSTKDDAFDYQVLNLTPKFYSDYPNPPYSELIRKKSRPYNCLLIQSSYGYFICIPYRSNINHKYSFKFKNSQRSKRGKSGLDYSKVVIVRNSDYIETSNAVVDQDEYVETRINIGHIKNDVQTYINDYVEYSAGRSDKYDEKKFNHIYLYSTLKYFHKELGI